LHRRAGDKDAAFEQIRRTTVVARTGLPAHCAEQLFVPRGGCIAHVHQHEAARAVGVFGHAGY